MLPSAIASSTPLTTMVWGVFQVEFVKVTDEGETVPSERSSEASEMVTFAEGCEVRTIVKFAVPPASVVTKPLEGETVTPATLLSILVTETLEGLIPLYKPSLLVACAVIMLYKILPSTIISLNPVTVTICGVFQFAAVKIT